MPEGSMRDGSAGIAGEGAMPNTAVAPRNSDMVCKKQPYGKTNRLWQKNKGSLLLHRHQQTTSS